MKIVKLIVIAVVFAAFVLSFSLNAASLAVYWGIPLALLYTLVVLVRWLMPDAK